MLDFFDNESLDDAASQFIVKKGLPFSMIDDPELVKLIDVTTKYGGKTKKVLSRYTLTNRLKNDHNCPPVWI